MPRLFSSSLFRPAQLLASLPLAMLLLTGCATQIFLHPQTAREAVAARPVASASYGDAPEIITVTNKFGHRLLGWAFFSPANTGVVLVGDGNATGIAQTYEYNRYLLHRGFNVLVLSYQGFDSNEGEADINSLFGDVESFYLFCQNRFPDERICLVAESISTAPFFCFASQQPEIAALVVEAMVNPKTVILTKLNDWWFLYPLYPLTFGVASLIGASVPENLDIKEALRKHPAIPTMFIHHPGDRITPCRAARRIFQQYEGPKEWIALRTARSWECHMSASYEPEVTERIVRFLKARLNP